MLSSLVDVLCFVAISVLLLLQMASKLLLLRMALPISGALPAGIMLTICLAVFTASCVWISSGMLQY